MRATLVMILFLSGIPFLFGQTDLGEIKTGHGQVVGFHRLTLDIPSGWNYSANPRARPGTDQLQLFSDDRNRTLVITLTKNRPEVDFIEAEHACRFEMLRRAMSIPEFQGCTVEGSSQDQDIWGRKGIFTKFDLFKDEQKNPGDRKLRIYNFGEQLMETDEVLFITAYIVGPEEPDTNAIVKSLVVKGK